MKLFWTAFITVVLFMDCMGFNLQPNTKYQQLDDTDLQAARQLAIEFTKGFLRTTDLAPLIKEHFVPDFIQRYTKGKSVDLGVRSSPRLYFVPGLEYNSLE